MKIIARLFRISSLVILAMFIFAGVLAALPTQWIDQLEPYSKEILLTVLFFSIVGGIWFTQSAYQHFPVFTFLAWTFFCWVIIICLGCLLMGTDPENMGKGLVSVTTALSLYIARIFVRTERNSFFFRHQLSGDLVPLEKANLTPQGLYLGKNLLLYEDINKIEYEEKLLTLQISSHSQLNTKLSFLLNENSSLVIETNHPQVPDLAKELEYKCQLKRYRNHWKLRWRLFFLAKIFLWAAIFYSYLLLDEMNFPGQSIVRILIVLLYTIQWMDLFYTAIIPIYPVPEESPPWFCIFGISFPLFWKGGISWTEKTRSIIIFAYLNDAFMQTMIVLFITVPFLGAGESFMALNCLLCVIGVIRALAAQFSLK